MSSSVRLLRGASPSNLRREFEYSASGLLLFLPGLGFRFCSVTCPGGRASQARGTAGAEPRAVAAGLAPVAFSVYRVQTPFQGAEPLLRTMFAAALVTMEHFNLKDDTVTGFT